MQRLERDRDPNLDVLHQLRGMEARIYQAITGMGGRVQKKRAEYLTIEQVAIRTALSDSHIRRAIYSGDLIACNLGSDSHPTWRVALKELEVWMERKKGGNPKVPPRSDMKDMVRRHLPDL
jgi:hypothetical protein